MLSRDDVPHNKRLSRPIELTVIEIESQPRLPRDIELLTIDENGDEIHVILWKTHQIDIDWREGQSYEIYGALGQRFSTPEGDRVELHSTRALRVKHIDQEDPTKLFVLGDTHIGFRHRPPSDKAPWARTIDGREIFVRCLDRARKEKVDGVIHVGDVFDHHNTEEDRNLVSEEIHRTVSAGIPFYYIFGNHDNEDGRRLLASTRGIHLANGVHHVRDQVNLIGVDHLGAQFPREPPRETSELFSRPNILVIHESPYPVIGNDGQFRYDGDKNKADLSDYIEAAPYSIDLIITGHLHVANQATLKDYDIPVLVTGPIAPISKVNEDNQPSTWMLTVDDEVDVHRCPVA